MAYNFGAGLGYTNPYSTNQFSPQAGTAGASDQMDYDAYAAAVRAAGGVPMSMAAWREAGRPSAASLHQAGVGKKPEGSATTSSASSQPFGLSPSSLGAFASATGRYAPQASDQLGQQLEQQRLAFLGSMLSRYL